MPTTSPCYRAGTGLRADTDVAVEDLAVGDRLKTADGGEVTIKWIGWRRVKAAAGPDRERILPVRIAKDAIGDGLPLRDLYVSPDHALFFDGTLIPAFALCNGATVTQEDVAEVTYYHVECERHAVLLAEGVAAESYLDTGNRSFFANAPDATMLHPDLAAEAYRRGAAAPWASSGEMVEAVRRRLAARAEALGFTRTSDPDLVLFADGRTIFPQSITAEKAVFAVPAEAQSLRLASRNVVPSVADPRWLGVAISRLVFSGHGLRHVIDADDPALHDGFHDVERDGERVWRWTNGAATLPYRPLPYAMRLELHLAQQIHYWLPPAVTEQAQHA